MTKILPKPKNDQNTSKIQKITKIPLKPKNNQIKLLEYPQNPKNDQNTPRNPKMTKISPETLK